MQPSLHFDKEKLTGQLRSTSVYQIDTGEWLATIHPTFELRRQGEYWCIGTSYHNATRHSTREAAVASYFTNQKPITSSYEELEQTVRARNVIIKQQLEETK